MCIRDSNYVSSYGNKYDPKHILSTRDPTKLKSKFQNHTWHNDTVHIVTQCCMSQAVAMAIQCCPVWGYVHIDTSVSTSLSFHLRVNSYLNKLHPYEHITHHHRLTAEQCMSIDDQSQWKWANAFWKNTSRYIIYCLTMCQVVPD